jgi:ABC-type nitrate/sulfonate/bicarbonate transport system permease component
LAPALLRRARADQVATLYTQWPRTTMAMGLGGAILNFAQYYSFQPKNLWATNIVAAALGIVFFVAVVVAERFVVRRAPENVA